MIRKVKAPMGYLAAFILWTIAVKTVDVRAIGPKESAVGFASLNQFIHNLTGTNMMLYTMTDWLSIVPFAVCGLFGVVGLVQLIRRKSLAKVDRDIIALGVFYIIVIGAYALFEIVPINYRPILIEGVLEVSYPSSTTMLVMCVMPTAAMQVGRRVRNMKIRRWAAAVTWIFTVFMVVGRIMSGVHWITDIIGGILLSTALVTGWWRCCH